MNSGGENTHTQTSYVSLMYESSNPPDELRTGDIVLLNPADFKKFVKHESILAIVEQFSKDKNYNAQLWAILNKPCDMVHDGKGRQFRANLFICPLIGLKAALRKGVIGEHLISLNKVPKASEVILNAYSTYIRKKAETENPKKPGEKNAIWKTSIASIATPTIEGLGKVLATADDEGEEPEDLLQALLELMQASDDKVLASSLIDFQTSSDWKTVTEEFEQTKKQAIEQSSKIVLKNKAAKAVLADLCLNQFDSKGIFFYEPSTSISSKTTDLSFVIQLQEMLTVKIKDSAIEQGDLFNTLMEKRVASLKESFSDRLLNIMGNYFSKIGTNDVKSDFVLLEYRKVYPEEFFTSEEEFKTYREAEKQKERPKNPK